MLYEVITRLLSRMRPSFGANDTYMSGELSNRVRKRFSLSSNARCDWTRSVISFMEPCKPITLPWLSNKALPAISIGMDWPRITSYNVCYTKLLRFVNMSKLYHFIIEEKAGGCVFDIFGLFVDVFNSLL